MRLLVFGGRDFDDRDILELCLEAALCRAGLSEIICGYDPEDKRYQGADQLAYEWAQREEFPCRTFPADWKTHKRAAGPIRNSQMADDKPDEGLCFPRKNGEWGTGTLDMWSKLNRRNVPVRPVLERYDPTRAATGRPLGPGTPNENTPSHRQGGET